jgi:hypothetical protein
MNNSSFILDNTITKMHMNGIAMIGNDGSTRCCPIIWRNTISICGLYGVIAEGAQSEPDIRGNIIMQNRKAGIKITDNAQA